MAGWPVRQVRKVCSMAVGQVASETDANSFARATHSGRCPTTTIVTVDPGSPRRVTALPLRSDLMLEPLALTMTAEEAVGVYRRLAAANPTDYEADLASLLSNLSGCLADAGRHDEALAAAGEAVAVYRRLAATDPAAYESDLATSLNNLSAEVVRGQEALFASLDNVWDMLDLAAQHQEAQHQEALDPIEEAVAIYRRLAAANPAAYEPDLAASLNQLSVLEQPAKLRFATSLLIVLVLMTIAQACLGIVILAVQVFTSWQEIKGQPLR